MQTQCLNSILTELNGLSIDIQGSGFVTTDGLVVASVLPENYDEDRFGAITAGMMSLSKSAFLESERDHIKQIFIQSSIGYLLILTINKEMALAILTHSHEKFYGFIEDVKFFAEKVCKF